jgi:hypothetical protein
MTFSSGAPDMTIPSRSGDDGGLSRTVSLFSEAGESVPRNAGYG